MAYSGKTSGPVLIAHAEKAFVSSALTLLESAGYHVSTATTGDEALRVARAERPLVFLLGIDLPVLNGYEVCHALREEFGQTVAIAFVSGTRTGPVDISSGLLVGADDYMLKPVDPCELLARVGALMRRVRAEHPTATTIPGGLTGRELEILGMLADGLAQAEIAQCLSISRKTVGTHIEHILGKLGVHSRAQAVAAAYRKRLVVPSR